MSAASQARRMNADLEIIAFERGEHVSYSACGEPYLVGGLIESIEPLIARTPAEFAQMDIEVRLRHEVDMIDLDRRLIQVRNLEDGSTTEVGFDHLMYATGSRPARPEYIEGIHLPGVAGLRTLDDAVALRDSLDHDVKRVLVLGGGYIGLEVAEALIGRGIEVTMVTSGKHVLERTLDDRMGELANRGTRKVGVELHTGMLVRCIARPESASTRWTSPPTWW
jgi:NADPH-dependent 2,4-dienoyl-CoA reductase/sulfur reductase-like enzyme